MDKITISVFEILLIFMSQGILIILAVITGSYVVFRTKRDSYDPFMQIQEKKGSAFNIGEEGNILPVEKEPELPSIIKKMNERFIKQTTTGEGG